MKITFEQLAERLNGKVWEKGDLKRVYLEEGFNTKKTKTTTYVEEVNGEFVVKCFVDCASQSLAWCKSQSNIVIENIQNKIEEILNPEIEIIEESAEEILKLEVFKKDCENVFEIVNDDMNLFQKLEVKNDYAVFYWTEYLAKSFKNTLFATPWQDGKNEFVMIKMSSYKNIKERIYERYNYYSQGVLAVEKFRNECKYLENKGYKICGNSLSHGQAQVMKDGKNVGHVHFMTITLK